jgi:glycerophosphoryl diester phosphodiesterase
VTLEWRMANARVVAQCKRAGLPVLTWTVDDPYIIQALRTAGVDGLTSNRPDMLMQVD